VTVPLWAAILIGLGSGLVATITRISYERTAELRTRMIQAADEFLTGGARATAALRNAGKTVGNVDVVIDADDAFHPEIQNDIATLDELFDDLRERFGRVQLLFGVPLESRAARHAEWVIISMRNCHNALAARPHSITPDPTAHVERPALQQWNRNFSLVITEQGEFSRAARREIRAGFLETGWHRVWNGPLLHRLRIWHALWRRRRTRDAGG
jgi:hypothetical protein